MKLFSLLKKNKNKDNKDNKNKDKNQNSRQLSLIERWRIDCESYANPNYKPKIGMCQCCNCKNKINNNPLTCSKFEDIPSDILNNKKECEYKIVENNN